MLLSTPTSNASARRFQQRSQRTPEPTQCSDSPMLTPSPLRRRPLFPQNDLNDEFSFLHSPFQSPNVQHMYSSYSATPEPISADDAEGAIFLDPATTSSRPIPTSVEPPLRTPVKRHALSVVQLNSPSSSFVGAGTKRKSTPLVSTPLRQHNLTPLSIHSAQNPSSSSALGFDRLAPLPPPKFSAKTPQSKAETDHHIRSHTATLTRLRISDFEGSGDEFDRQAIDSGCDVSDDEDQAGNIFFASAQSRAPAHPGVLEGKASKKEEEVAAISPGGHITKRRARSRPVSEELLESVYRSPSHHKKPIERKKKVAPPDPVPFPSNRVHRRNGSASSSSDLGSPLPRRRTSAGPTRPPKGLNPIGLPRPVPRPLNRVESATLFFGPPIPAPATTGPIRTRTNSSMASSVSTGHLLTRRLSKPNNRHSYAGPGQAHIWNAMRTDAGTPSPHSSPIGETDAANSSRDTDMEEDIFFGIEPGNTSFALRPDGAAFTFNLTEGTPSPRNKQTPQTLPKKYRPRDSGVVVSDDDDYDDRRLAPAGGSFHSLMPKASTSVNSIDSDADEGLVTPGIGPGQFSGWPDAHVRINDSSTSIDGILSTSNPDAFIMRALNGGIKGPQGRSSNGTDGESKRPPGTPVKKIKTTYLNGDRPWQSAITHKVADIDFDYGHGFGLASHARELGKKGKNKPRQSLPALPLAMGRNTRGLSHGGGSDTDDDQDSPSGRKEKSTKGRAALYDGLGLGRPVKKADIEKPASAVSRTRWLMRRSSSGALSFSSGSDSSRDTTPTRASLAEREPPFARVSAQHSPSKNALKLSPLRSASGSSSSSAGTINSPSVRPLPIGAGPSRTRKSSRPSLPLPSSNVNETRRGPRAATQRLSTGPHPYGNRLPRSRLSDSFAYEQPGRFERDFVEADEIGSGEFGKVIKVRTKDTSTGGRAYAIKKSKRFEGVRHRLRLREEVDTLQHLARLTSVASGGTETSHPNVLGYVDSWEEDEALFIQTELCELGNLSRFLWEYGRAFPRLDEARVWKIVVDLSNGLRFIHDSGIIHLDIKPANIFITSEGRFKIGDFGMASFWPRRSLLEGLEGMDSPTKQGSGVRASLGAGPFEREGDKLYLAPEVLQGRYGKAADMFSLGMTILETASNIIVPDQGEAWHRLRQEDFSLVDLDCSPELLGLVRSMMRTDPEQRVGVEDVYGHPVVVRARRLMELAMKDAVRQGGNVFNASPLGSVGDGFLEEILCRKALDAMDVCS